jgi:ribokinase
MNTEVGKHASDGSSGDGGHHRDGQRYGEILVVGSANMDMVVSVDRFPLPGETVFGRDFAMHPGGKGANQAVGAARLGARVSFIGKMGRDAFRDRLVAGMEAHGIDLCYLREDPTEPTGTALITVDGSAQNEIVVISGSNMTLTPEDVEACEEAFEAASVVLMQLEIPVPVIARAARMARAHKAMVILNPAPACDLPDDLLGMVDILTPNETEATALTGMSVDTLEAAEAAGKALVARGVRHVVLTLGERGALLVTANEARHFPAIEVEAVDTTAAGDAFNGALAHFLVSTGSVHEAARMANIVAALSIRRAGAQPSMPDLDELTQFLASDGEAEPVPAGSS